MAYEMMVQYGMRIDDFFSQDLELFLRATEAATTEEIIFIDELE